MLLIFAFATECLDMIGCNNVAHEYVLMMLQDATRTIFLILLQHLFYFIFHEWTAVLHSSMQLTVTNFMPASEVKGTF